jgi:hypothetical protein
MLSKMVEQEAQGREYRNWLRPKVKLSSGTTQDGEDVLVACLAAGVCTY